MLDFDKTFPYLSKIEDNAFSVLPHFDKVSTKNNISFVLNDPKYSELREYLEFCSSGVLENFMDDDHTTALYYFIKTLNKLVPSIGLRLEKGEKVGLLSFLTEAFFLTRDSRIGNIPVAVNKRMSEFNDDINWEILRKDFPLAAKSNNYLLTNKTFLEEVKNKFLSDYSSKNPRFYEHMMKQIKEVKDPNELCRDIIHTLTDIENGPDMMEIYIKDYLLKGVWDRFYMDHEKKKRRQEQAQDKKVATVDNEKNESIDKMLKTDADEMFSKIKLLDEGQISLIDKIVENFTILGEKNQKQIRKYLVRLLVNKKPFKVDDFLENYNLESLPDVVVVLLDDLGIDVLFKQEDEEVQHPVSSIIEQEKDEVKEAHEKELEEINKKLGSLFMKNPLLAIIEKAKLCGYEIENENVLKKQIESICKSSKYVKDSLLLSLFKESFSRPILKNTGAYSLKAGGSGYRFVLRQNEGGKFVIIGFYNHDDYEKIINGKR